MSCVISVENISKKYRLGAIGATSLRDEIERWGRRFRGKEAVEDKGEFWALRDITFEVEEGQVLGIIGKNGAGKSTLLKILSRITVPTKGRIKMRGRVASLLEVGTGFHPELSGRDNIYLNGAILGMRKAEIDTKFDEIVAFAEVEQFIDTPVKRYSSGMYVRLAFAVAAHLESEILIIDEVLAVGDYEFQKKCLQKMGDLSSDGGRTVLYISHNMNTVETLCNKCLFLQDGRQQLISDDVQSVVRRYLDIESKKVGTEWCNTGDHGSNEWFELEWLAVVDAEDRLRTTPFRADEAVRVRITGTVLNAHRGLQIGIGLFNGNNELLFWSTIKDQAEREWIPIETGKLELSLELPKGLLNEGNYRVELFLGIYHQEWIHKPGENSPSVCFEISGGLSESPFWISARPGIFAPTLVWERLKR